MPRGSLPWLFLAAILSTLFAVYLESALLHPFIDAILSTSAWQTSTNQYAAAGKRMIADFARSLLIVIVLGIWTGVLIDARRAV